MPDVHTSQALISPCGNYRYWLKRQWDRDRPELAFVMLNPSRADATIDDPTIRCCIRLAQREGFGGIHVVNLFAFRTPNRTLLSQVPDPVGPHNDRYIRSAAEHCPVTVLGWGGYVVDSQRVRSVIQLLHSARTLLKCLEMIGPADNQQPRHPLYLRRTAKLRNFPVRSFIT